MPVRPTVIHRNRRRVLCLATTFLLLLLAPGIAPAAPAERPGEALLAKVAAKYAAARSLSARFRQEVPLQNLGIVRKAAGRLHLARPMRMRWDYQAPDGQLFLADGRHLYFRPADSDRVVRRRIDEGALGGRIPLLLFFGQGNVSEMFRVEEAAALAGRGAVSLRLVPKGEGAPDVRRVELVVGEADAVIREIHIHDRMGGANHLYLEDTVFNPSLPDDMFRFRKPRGTEVVDG